MFRILFLSNLLLMSICQEDLPKSKVAIIGAGVAGLSTANRFLEKGFDNFEVFEALDRTGGRVWPIKYSECNMPSGDKDFKILKIFFAEDGYLQMGAQYINGDKNPLFDLASKLGVVSHIVGDFSHFDEAEIRYGNCPIQE